MVDFLVIGSFNVVMYSTIFPHIMNDKIRLGYNRIGEFCDGLQTNSIWLSSIDVDRTELLELTKTYDGSYKKFDNYDVINVDRTADIPGDYEGVMGVPITFLEKWNPRQFDVVGLLNDGCYIDEDGLQGAGGLHMTSVNGIYKYARILIRRKK